MVSVSNSDAKKEGGLLVYSGIPLAVEWLVIKKILESKQMALVYQ